MTVVAEVLSEQYPGNGVATEFDFDFTIFDSSEIEVRDIVDSTGVATLLTIDDDYTLEVNENGGTVTLSTATAVGHTLDVRPVFEITQPTRIKNQGTFRPEVHERALDRLTSQQQMLLRKIQRCPHLPDYGEDDAVLELPSLSARAGKYAVYDAQGEPAASAGTGNDSALRTDLATTTAGTDGSRLVGFRHTESGATGISIFTRLRKSYYVTDFGAAADGTTNDTAAFEAAYAACAAAKRDLLIPNGDYALSSNQLLWDEAVNVLGESREFTRLIKKGGNFDLIRIDQNGQESTYREFMLTRAASLGGAGNGVGLDVWLGNRITLDKIWVTDFTSHGILFRAGNLGTFRDLRLRLNGGDGMRVHSFTGTGGLANSANACSWDGHHDYGSNTGWGLNIIVGDSHKSGGIISTQDNTAGGFRCEDIKNSFTVYSENNTGRDIHLTSTAQRNRLVVVNAATPDGVQDDNGNNTIVPLHLLAGVLAPLFGPGRVANGVNGRTCTFTGGAGGGGASGTTGGIGELVGGDAGGGTTAAGGKVRLAGGSGANGGAQGVIELGNALQHKQVALAYSANIATNARAGNAFVVTPTNGSAYTMTNPTNLVEGQFITYTQVNTTGGALGGCTWDTIFKLAAWTQPATGFQRSITFKYNGANLIEVSRNTADVPN
jgi:hypothetical protein